MTLTKGISIEKYPSSFNKYHIYLLPLLKPPEFLRIFIRKNWPFSCRAKECFHSAKRSFYPPAVPTGITHYTLHCKVVRQRGTLWNPFLPNDRQKIARNIFQKGRPVSCYFAMGVIVSPIANVLICYNRMYGTFRNIETFCRTSYCGFVFYNVFGKLDSSFFNIIFHIFTPK